MNLGTVGFLLNQYDTDNLLERVSKAIPFQLHPLRMEAIDIDGNKTDAIAFNEISLLNQYCVVCEAHSVSQDFGVLGDAFFFVEQVEAFDELLDILASKSPTVVEVAAPEPNLAIFCHKLRLQTSGID